MIIDTLIYDRTNADVLHKTEKAYCAYTDLNRIEEACAYVAGKLGLSIITKTWLITDLRTTSEMERIRSNLNLIRSLLSRSITPSVPVTVDFSSISQANDIEGLLYDINNFYENIITGCPRLSMRLGGKQLGNKGVRYGT